MSVRQLLRFNSQYMEHTIHRKVTESESETNIGLSRQTYFRSGVIITVFTDFKKFSVHYKNDQVEDQQTDTRTESQKSKNKTIKHS